MLKNFILYASIIFLLFNCGKETKKKVITYAGYCTPEELPIMQNAFKEFEENNPDIKVNFVWVSIWNEYWAKILTMIAGGETPDVMYMGGEFLPPMAKKGVLEPLDSYLENDKEIKKSDFFPQALESYTYKGKLYGIPRDVAPVLMYYNKDIFDRFGLKYPDETWDWKKLVEVSKKLTKDLNNDGIIDQFGFDVYGAGELYQCFRFIQQNGGSIFSDDRKKSNLNKKEAIEALQFLADLIFKYHIAPKPHERSGIDLFVSGRIAMHEDGYWMVSHYRKEIKNFKWDVAPIIKNKKRVGTLFGTSYVMAATSKNKEAAWKLIKFIAGPKIQEFNLRKELAIPALKTVALRKDILELPYVKKFVDAIEYSVPPPFIEEWHEFAHIFSLEGDKIFSPENPQKAQEICPIMANKINKIMQNEKTK